MILCSSFRPEEVPQEVVRGGSQQTTNREYICDSAYVFLKGRLRNVFPL
jgi:hypothetical protein